MKLHLYTVITFLILLPLALQAQEGKIDMHGKEDYSISSSKVLEKNYHSESMKEMLASSNKKKTTKPFSKKDTYTVEEVFMWRKDLKDQTITLEGTVLKISRGIMNLDWVHLQDGSGDKIKRTHKLLLTASNAECTIGDRVKATGKVTIDKDLGHGYFYKVLLEDTTFKVL